MRFIAKPNTWYDEGTEAFVVDDCVWDGFADREMRIPMKAGLFRGLRNGQWDEETCGFDEFEIKESL